LRSPVEAADHLDGKDGDRKLARESTPSESGTRRLARWLRNTRQLIPRGAIGVDGESPNSAVVTDNDVLVIRVRGDRERFSFHGRSLN